MTNDPSAPITEDDLHAYVDGALDAARARAVAAHLAENPALALQVDAWRRHESELADLLSPYHYGDAADLPEQMPGATRAPGGDRHRERRARTALAAGALVVVFGLGAAAGFVGRGPAIPAPGSLWLETAARDVHLTYANEVRHPVEVGADERDHLVSWLGNRIERPFTAPSLSPIGFSLVGGRLLPLNGAPGAMLMYENAQGDRTTILLARNAGARDTAFQYSRDSGVGTFRWIDGPLAYAISGLVARDTLEEISRMVYDHFEAI